MVYANDVSHDVKRTEDRTKRFPSAHDVVASGTTQEELNVNLGHVRPTGKLGGLRGEGANLPL